MKSKKYIFNRMASCVLAASFFVLFSSELGAGFSKPTLGTAPASEEEISSAVNSIESGSRSEENNYFANSLVLNGNEIYNYLNNSRANTIVVYFGYSMSGNYNDPNKVIVIAPVDKNYNTIANVDFLMYDKSNMHFGPNTFESDQTKANTPGKVINVPLAKTYIQNLDENQEKDMVRGVLLQRSTLDKMVKNSRGAITNNIRLSFGSDAAGERIVVVSAADQANGMSTKQGPIEVLDASSLCPNNCDIY